MSILAIDPGSEKSAWVIWNGKEILAKGITDNNELNPYAHNISEKWDDAVIEMVACYGMPVGKEVFDTCVWIGRFQEQFIQSGNEATFLYRKDVKVHLCHSMKANDSNIRQALIDRFGKPGTKKVPGILYGVHKDMWAALAVAVTWWDKHNGI